MGALLNPDKAILRNIVIITLILVEARIISLYGLYRKSQARRAIGRVGVMGDLAPRQRARNA